MGRWYGIGGDCFAKLPPEMEGILHIYLRSASQEVNETSLCWDSTSPFLPACWIGSSFSELSLTPVGAPSMLSSMLFADFPFSHLCQLATTKLAMILMALRLGKDCSHQLFHLAGNLNRAILYHPSLEKATLVFGGAPRSIYAT